VKATMKDLYQAKFSQGKGKKTNLEFVLRREIKKDVSEVHNVKGLTPRKE